MITHFLMKIWQNLLGIFDPELLIKQGGLLILFLVVFGQTGLFFCFFLPGGAILFTSGVFIATGGLHHSFFTVCIVLIIAAFSGNITGYLFGLKTGPLLYKRKDSKFFRKKHLATAESFYQKHGGVALTAGLFFPIIRTFSPIVAGMIRVNFRRFIMFTFAGSVFWVLSSVLAGYLLGSIPAIKKYLPYILITIILAVTTPVLIKIIKRFKNANKEDNKAG